MMTKMTRKINIFASLTLLTLLVLCPLSAVYSEEPSDPREENTLGEGLKAIQEAEGKLDPDEATKDEAAPQADEKVQESAENLDSTEQPVNEQEPEAQQANVDQEKENNENGILTIPEDQKEASLPRGEDLRGTQKPRYSSAGLRDPFKPFLKLVNVPVGPDPIIRPPLRRYPLSSFRLAGIIWVGDQPKAMIVDPEENTYFLGVGDRIGNKEGEILEVRERGILVQEQTRFENVYGEVKTETKKSVLAF